MATFSGFLVTAVVTSLTGLKNVHNETLSSAWVVKDNKASRRSMRTDGILDSFAA